MVSSGNGGRVQVGVIGGGSEGVVGGVSGSGAGAGPGSGSGMDLGWIWDGSGWFRPARFQPGSGSGSWPDSGPIQS